MGVFKNISLFQVSMGAKSGIICLLIISASMSGCVTEEFCGDLATFEYNHPIATSYFVVSSLAGLPCEAVGANAAGAICWTVKGTAKIYDATTELCLGYFLSTCVTSGGDSGCEEAKNLAPYELKIAFIVTEESSEYMVGDVREEINEFAPISYVVVDDFSSATWEFTIDEEGNIYHFF